MQSSFFSEWLSRKPRQLTTGRILIAVYLLVCIAVGYSIYPILQVSNQGIAAYKQIFDNSTRKLELMNSLRKNFNTLQSAQFRHLLSYSEIMMKEEESKIRATSAANDAIFEEYKHLVESTDEQRLLDSVLTLRAINALTREELVALSGANKRADAFNYYITIQEKSRLLYSEGLEDLTEFIVAETHQDLVHTEDYIRGKRFSINVVLGISVVLLVMTGFMVVTTNKKLNKQHAQLSSQEAKYHTIVDATDEMIFNVNHDGDLTWANKATMRNLQYGQDELLLKPFSELLAEPREQPFESWNGMQGGIHEFSEALRGKDGNIIHVEGKTILVEEPDGKRTAQVFVRNITDRKKAEARLRSTSMQLEKVLNIFENSFWGSDVVSRKMLYVSPGNERVFGYPEKDFMSNGNLWYELVLDEDKPRFREAWSRLGQGKSTFAEFRIVHPQKGIRWVESKMAPTMDAEGRLVRIDGIAIDITERKKSEVELKENNAELKKINSELDSFVYSTSHDLRAPLLSLEGLINLAEEHSDEREEVRQYLSIMRKITSEMDDTIKNILDYSRNARQDIVAERLDIREMIDNAVIRTRHRKGGEGIRLQVHVDDDVTFYSDKLRMNTVINNLVSNAYKFSRPVEQDRWVNITFTATAEEGRLVVQDNGEGIPAEYIDKIYDMFMRASENSEGSGLGLYICREIVNRLHGDIRVHSVFNEGTTFVVRIPNMTQPVLYETSRTVSG